MFFNIAIPNLARELFLNEAIHNVTVFLPPVMERELRPDVFSNVSVFGDSFFAANIVTIVLDASSFTNSQSFGDDTFVEFISGTGQTNSMFVNAGDDFLQVNSAGDYAQYAP